jgi:hypothetical protein
MEATTKNELYSLVDEAMLREIADTVGRRLARDYGSCIQGVTSLLNAEGVQLRIHAVGPYRDIRMQFIDDPMPVRTLFADVDDAEL